MSPTTCSCPPPQQAQTNSRSWSGLVPLEVPVPSLPLALLLPPLPLEAPSSTSSRYEFRNKKIRSRPPTNSSRAPMVRRPSTPSSSPAKWTRTSQATSRLSSPTSSPIKVCLQASIYSALEPVPSPSLDQTPSLLFLPTAPLSFWDLFLLPLLLAPPRLPQQLWLRRAQRLRPLARRLRSQLRVLRCRSTRSAEGRDGREARFVLLGRLVLPARFITPSVCSLGICRFIQDSSKCIKGQ